MTDDHRPKRNKMVRHTDHGMWVVHCALCGRRRARKMFDIPQECDEWWGIHAKSEQHLRHFTPESQETARKRQQEMVWLRRVFRGVE